jgi:hypothetical protein
MGYDTDYNASTAGGGPDNVMGDNNNYRQVLGAYCKVGRCVAAEYKQIDDDESIGNRAWVELRRELDTSVTRQRFVYYTEQAVKWLVDNGEITDLEITVGDPQATTGVALLVKFKDVRTDDEATLGFIAPWGRV